MERMSGQPPFTILYL